MEKIFYCFVYVLQAVVADGVKEVFKSAQNIFFMVACFLPSFAPVAS